GNAYGANFSGGYGTLVGRLNNKDLELPPFEILIQQAQYGIAIQNIKSTLSAEAPKEGTFRASLGPSTGNTLDSTVQIGKINFPPAEEGNLLVPVRAENLSLQKLVELVPDSPIDATGYLEATLPIKIAPGGVSISSGALRSRPPGGKIQYRPKEDSASALGDQYRLVAQALEDYEYTRLEADVELDPKGEMLIKARLSGTNKKLNKTRPIDVNVNIEQNLFKLLESIRMVRQFGQ
ncbi:MAG: YdbH domain-containing protein, partial [Bdellovibrionales bacterium]|nr:YdbH domain-containing protein [Bdellovibrionales bacterium]